MTVRRSEQQVIAGAAQDRRREVKERMAYNAEITKSHKGKDAVPCTELYVQKYVKAEDS